MTTIDPAVQKLIDEAVAAERAACAEEIRKEIDSARRNAPHPCAVNFLEYAEKHVRARGPASPRLSLAFEPTPEDLRRLPVLGDFTGLTEYQLVVALVKKLADAPKASSAPPVPAPVPARNFWLVAWRVGDSPQMHAIAYMTEREAVEHRADIAGYEGVSALPALPIVNLDLSRIVAHALGNELPLVSPRAALPMPAWKRKALSAVARLLAHVNSPITTTIAGRVEEADAANERTVRDILALPDGFPSLDALAEGLQARSRVDDSSWKTEALDLAATIVECVAEPIQGGAESDPTAAKANASALWHHVSAWARRAGCNVVQAGEPPREVSQQQAPSWEIDEFRDARGPRPELRTLAPGAIFETALGYLGVKASGPVEHGQCSVVWFATGNVGTMPAHAPVEEVFGVKRAESKQAQPVDLFAELERLGARIVRDVSASTFVLGVYFSGAAARHDLTLANWGSLDALESLIAWAKQVVPPPWYIQLTADEAALVWQRRPIGDHAELRILRPFGIRPGWMFSFAHVDVYEPVATDTKALESGGGAP